MMSEAPSAASSSATARPRPWLAAATNATFPFSPRSIKCIGGVSPAGAATSGRRLRARRPQDSRRDGGVTLLLPKIIVGLVQPVLARWAKNIDVESVLKGLGL